MKESRLLAIAVTGLLNVAVALGQSFSLTISTPHPVVRVGDQINVDVALVNVTDHDVPRPPISTPVCDYRIDVERHTEHRVSEPNCSGSRLKGLPLKPKERMAAHVSLTPVPLTPGNDASAKFNFSKPGNYVILFSRWDPSSARTIKSNKITVKVLPTRSDPE